MIFSESVKRNPKLLLLSLLLRAHVRFVRSGYSAGRALFFRGGLSGGASAAGMAGVREREYSETQRKPIRDSLFLHFGLTRSKELITFAFRVTAKPAGSRQVAGPSQTANLTYDMQSFTPEVQKRFKYWQMRTLIATMIGYALFYFVRKNFSLAMPGLEADLGISKTSLGIFLTLNGLVYGLSRFVNGILADRLNARFFMATGLALCALANFAFGFGVDVSEWITGESSGSQFNNTLILFMGVMWVVNGMLQGTGFPPCARLLTHWIPPKELATKMSVWNTSHSIGAGLVVILCGYIMSHMGTGDAHVGAWRWCFWIPAGISFAGAIGLFISLRDTPTSVGLPELPGTESKKSGDAPSAADKAFLRRKVFGNPLIWILAFANFFVYIVRFSVLDWGPTLLSQSKGVSMSHAGWLVAMFEIAGIVGAGGRLGDRQVPQRTRAPHLRLLHGGCGAVHLPLLAAARRRAAVADVPLPDDGRFLHLRAAGAHRHRRRAAGYQEGGRHGQRLHRPVRLRLDDRVGCRTGLSGAALRLEPRLHRHDRHGTRRHGGLPADVGRRTRRVRDGRRITSSVCDGRFLVSA